MMKPSVTVTSTAPPPPDVAEPEHYVAWAVSTFPGRTALTCSFGGVSGMVLLDLVMKADPSVPVLVLDTGLLFDETYRLIERVEARYGIRTVRLRPQRTVDEQAIEYGPRLWERQPDVCCKMRKVEPLAEAMASYDAWITGVRRDQSSTRVDAAAVAWNDKHHLWKVCPLVGWSEERTWAYVYAQDLPYNPLLAEGYTSIGCRTCTKKPTSSDPRSGRWAGLGKTECGLHL